MSSVPVPGGWEFWGQGGEGLTSAIKGSVQPTLQKEAGKCKPVRFTGGGQPEVFGKHH